MKHLLTLLLSALVLLSVVMFSCQGKEGAEGSDPNKCYFLVNFVVTSTPCAPDQYLGFSLAFEDELGQITISEDFLVPDGNVYHLIGLPSGHTYKAYVLENGEQNGWCGGTISFQIRISTLKDGNYELCDIFNATLNGRPSPCCGDPLASFVLPKECDGNCIRIIDEDCGEDCGGFYSGSQSTPGYYSYPEETLGLCSDDVACVSGIPIDVPNRFTVRENGVIIDSKWVGDAQTYPNQYYGTNLPTSYNFCFNPSPGKIYTLQVESIVPTTHNDAWQATVSCGAK